MSKRSPWPIFVILAVVVAAALLWWATKGGKELSTVLPALPSFPAPRTSETPIIAPFSAASEPTPETWTASDEQSPIEHPVETPPPSAPLPALEDSDATAHEVLTELVRDAARRDLFEPEHLIRKIVVTIDNLAVPGGKVALKIRPVKPIAGQFITGGDEDHPVIGEQNAARYAAIVQLIESVDTALLVASYTRLYPLFQQAYTDLGYPNRYFNDRLVQVVDHLLAAPEITGPIPLVQPKVFYQFADPDLEAASPGHKIMLRIGLANAARVKAKLLEIRQALLAAPVSGKTRVDGGTQ